MAERALPSILDLIKRFVHDWPSRRDSLDYNDLRALANALDVWKDEVRQKLIEKTVANTDESQIARSARTRKINRPVRTSWANQDVRRSTRLLESGTARADSGTLFVTDDEDETEPGYGEQESQSKTPDAALNRELTLPSVFTTQGGQIMRSNALGDGEDDHDEEGTTTTSEAEDHERSPHYSQNSVQAPRLSPMFSATEIGELLLDDEMPSDFFNEAFDAIFDARTQNILDLDAVDNMEGVQYHIGNNPLSEEQRPTEQVTSLLDEACTDSPQHSNEEFTDSPQHFNEAFEGLYGEKSEQDVGGFEPHSFAKDPAFKTYLEIACRSNFRLPHLSLDSDTPIQPSDVLLPLVNEVPLTTELVHGLLHALHPGSLHIVEVTSDSLHKQNLLDAEWKDDFVTIETRTGNTLPLIVLGDKTTKTLFILESSTADLSIMQFFPPEFSDWSTVYMDPYTVGPHIEPTLLSIFMAEACFCNLLPIKEIPTSHNLRLRFLEELVAPYERDAVLTRCGILYEPTPSQKVDTRVIVPRSSALPPPDEDSIPTLQNFDMSALRIAFRDKPAEVTRLRCLRILQYVNEIGSTSILDSLKTALVSSPLDRTAQIMGEALFEKLFHIHVYLDGQESQSHLLVARNRYIKYCYFETYELTVKALQEEKRVSNREMRKVSALKVTASYKQGLRKELPSTPHTDSIHRSYKDLTDEEKKRRAPDIVKNEIARKVSMNCGGDEAKVRQNIIRYIKEGRVLHLILRDTRCLNPGLLILFPSWDSQPPHLNLDHFRPEIQVNERKKLSKPIKMKDIDGLTLAEAGWFGTVLQARPDLRERVPNDVLNIISNSFIDTVDFRERNPDSFSDKPLRFFS